MLVEIQSNDNGSGMNTMLYVHRATNDKMKLFEQKPIVSIEEDNFLNYSLILKKNLKKHKMGRFILEYLFQN